MEKVKIALRLLKVRLYAAGRILFRPKERFILLRIDEKNLEKMVVIDQCHDRPDFSEIDVDFSYHRLQLYNVYKLLKVVADQIDPDELVLMKADYEVEAEEWISKNPG